MTTDELSILKIETEKNIARYNNLQLARKVQLNSAYGALGNAWFRFYDTRLAEGITMSGQLAIRWIEKHVNGFMNRTLKTNNADYVIAVDTDSIYLILDKIVQQVIPDVSDTARVIKFMDNLCQKELLPFISKSYDDLASYVNAYKQSMIMKREVLADKVIWTSKKRYIVNVWNNEGVALKEAKMKIMGLEMIKSSSPEICRAKMKEAVKLIISGTEDDLITYINKFQKDFKNLPPEDLAFPRGVNGIIKYGDPITGMPISRTPMHTRGSLIYNHIIKTRNLDKKYQLIHEGDKIKFINMKMPNPFNSNVMAFPLRSPPELELEKYIDYDMQFNKTFLDPLKIITEAIKWKTEKVVNTIDSFFT